MEIEIKERLELETMSTLDLITLAEQIGIDVPLSLNRRFLIGEILEVYEEQESLKEKNEDEIEETENVELSDELPVTYNETMINVLLQNPSWAFIYWDINEADFNEIVSNPSFENFFIHLAYFDSEDSCIPFETQELKISTDIREQFFCIPGDKDYIAVSLAASFTGASAEILKTTEKICIPRECEAISSYQPGKKTDHNELVQLSGLKTILHNHYINHRSVDF